MELQRKLRGHAGCVNTCSFDTENGSMLITGSDDLQIILWNWEDGGLSFPSWACSSSGMQLQVYVCMIDHQSVYHSGCKHMGYAMQAACINWCLQLLTASPLSGFVSFRQLLLHCTCVQAASGSGSTASTGAMCFR
jgi:WD40 repeat protein